MFILQSLFCVCQMEHIFNAQLKVLIKYTEVQCYIIQYISLCILFKQFEI